MGAVGGFCPVEGNERYGAAEFGRVIGRVIQFIAIYPCRNAIGMWAENNVRIAVVVEVRKAQIVQGRLTLSRQDVLECDGGSDAIAGPGLVKPFFRVVQVGGDFDGPGLGQDAVDERAYRVTGDWNFP